MTDKILVTGATGIVGRALVQRLLAEGLEVKAGTRSPGLADYLFGGAEVVELDYDVTATWDAAVQWADRVFLVPPPFDSRADERLVPFLDWAVQSGARQLVLLSAMAVDAREPLALSRVEERVKRTGVEFTFLRPNIYMQNFARGFVARAIRQKGVFRLPVGGARVSFVDGRDVAAVAARVLAEPGHDGRTYTLTGPDSLTADQVADVLGEVTGRTIRYEAISEATLRDILAGDHWAAGQADSFVTLMDVVREGHREDVTPLVEELTGEPPIRFRSFAEEHADVWAAPS